MSTATMVESTACTTKPVRAEGSRFAALGCACLFGALLVPSPADAGVLIAPDFPISPLHPETAGALAAMRWQAQATAMTAGPVIESDRDVGVVFPTSNSLLVPGEARVLAVPTDVAPLYRDAYASASVWSFQSMDAIRAAAAVTLNKIDRASASANLWNMDLVTITQGGKFDLDLELTGAASKEVAPESIPNPSFARGFATADIYFWQYGVGGLNRNPPPKDTAFFFNYHAHWSLTPEAGLVKTDDGPFVGTLEAGSKWWIATNLNLGAVAQASNRLVFQADPGLVAVADLSHTLEIHFDPNPSTPDASYIAASGTDYRTLLAPPPPNGSVPEPGTLALLSLGLAGMATARRRARR